MPRVGRVTRSDGNHHHGPTTSIWHSYCLQRYLSHAQPAMAKGRRIGTRRQAAPAKRLRRRRRARGANRTYATRVLATGVGGTARRAFGSMTGHTLACWDAKHLHHLPLPRAVGPYTVIRATKRVQISTYANIIGTIQVGGAYSDAGSWSTICMISDVTSSGNINGPNNAHVTVLPLDGLGGAATLVPSALSVQVMCPTALQTASGIVYAGVMNTQAQISGRGETWNSYMDKFVQFQNPRLLAASKLALRGVQMNSYPLNMSEVSRFTSLAQNSAGILTLSADKFVPVGWAPIVIYNPNGVTLELLITMEFRVRFDLDNPASASHSHHPIASDSVWDSLVRKATSLGNGVCDIADVVANTGMAVGKAMAVADRIGSAGGALLALGA